MFEQGRAKDREIHVLAVAVSERWRSADGRFSVYVMRNEASEEEFVAAGEVGSFAPGELARLVGRYEEHSTHGRQFRVSSATPVLPTTKDGIARYLGSGAVPGVGPAIAERLVKAFGERTLDVIATQSARITEVNGIGKKKAQLIAESVRARRADADQLSFLHALGLGPSLSRKLFQKYGPRTPTVLREDPYRAAEEVPGVGFSTADRIGREVGIAEDDPRRAAGAALHVIGRAADRGHVFLPRSLARSEVIGLGVPERTADAAISDLARRGLLHEEGGAVYAPPLYEAETRAAEAIARLSRTRPSSSNPQRIEETLAIARREQSLTDRQTEAVRATLEQSFLVLTGGPGTGKTTTLRAIVRAHEALGQRVVLCAPTGRAAKRMSEASGREARTIHRLLEWNPREGTFVRSEEQPIEADLIVIDESSMLDVRLADSLFAAVRAGTAVVLVGDVDQLPPVGAGQVLREVIASGVCKLVRLDRVFRQAEESAIVRAAHEVGQGRLPSSSAQATRDGDFFIVEASDPDAVREKLTQVLTRISARYGLDAQREVQVLSPMRKGPLGTDSLNELMQREHNPNGASAGRFRRGDKVMQTRNDYEREVWNGDIGWIAKVEAGVVYVDFEGRLVSYPSDELDPLVLAYASTVHKAQGSEIPAVVLVLHSSHHMLLSRPLLYTALTRAKRVAVVIGEKRALAKAARTADERKSFCALSVRVRAIVERGDALST